VQLLLHEDRQVLPSCALVFFDEGGEESLLALAQFVWAPRSWDIVHMAVEGVLLQDVLHSTLAAANSLRYHLV